MVLVVQKMHTVHHGLVSPSPLAGEGGFERNRVRGLSPREGTPHLARISAEFIIGRRVRADPLAQFSPPSPARGFAQ
jgi:hypothetical protein